MKTEWWYDGSFISYETLNETTQDLCLARLTILDDGTVQILFPNGRMTDFVSEDDALIWLGDEEYRRLEDLMQDFLDDGKSIDPVIKTPSARSEQELLKEMRIRIASK